MDQDQPRLNLKYRVYLLRAWQEQEGPAQNPGEWRLSLQDTETGLRRGFVSLETLFDYLLQELSGDYLNRAENVRSEQSGKE